MKKIVSSVLENRVFQFLLLVIALFLIHSFYNLIVELLSIKTFITNFIINVLIVFVVLAIYFIQQKNKVQSSIWNNYKYYKMRQYLTLIIGLSLIILMNTYSLLRFNDSYFINFFDFRYMEMEDENNVSNKILTFFHDKENLFSVIFAFQSILLLLPVIFLLKVIFLYVEQKYVGLESGTFVVKYIYKSKKLYIFKIECYSSNYKTFGYFNDCYELSVEKLEKLINEKSPVFLETFIKKGYVKIHDKEVSINSFSIDYESQLNITFLYDSYKNIRMFCDDKDISIDVFYN